MPRERSWVGPSPSVSDDQIRRKTHRQVDTRTLTQQQTHIYVRRYPHAVYFLFFSSSRNSIPRNVPRSPIRRKNSSTNRLIYPHRSNQTPHRLLEQETPKTFLEQRSAQRVVHFMGRTERDGVLLPEGSTTQDGRMPGVSVELPRTASHREV